MRIQSCPTWTFPGCTWTDRGGGGVRLSSRGKTALGIFTQLDSQDTVYVSKTLFKDNLLSVVRLTRKKSH